MQYTSWQDRLQPLQVHCTVHKSLKSWISVCFFLQTLKWMDNLGLVTQWSITALQSMNLTVSYPVHFALESFFHGRPSRYLLIKSVQLVSFIEYTFILVLSNGILITFWRSIFSKVLSPQTLYPCKSTIIVTSSSLSLVSQLESPTRIRKYVRLYKWTDSEDTIIIGISTLCTYLIVILLGGAYCRCALKMSEWIIPAFALNIHELP